jgi:hypothetical protein
LTITAKSKEKRIVEGPHFQIFKFSNFQIDSWEIVTFGHASLAIHPAAPSIDTGCPEQSVYTEIRRAGPSRLPGVEAGKHHPGFFVGP